MCLLFYSAHTFLKGMRSGGVRDNSRADPEKKGSGKGRGY